MGYQRLDKSVRAAYIVEHQTQRSLYRDCLAPAAATSVSAMSGSLQRVPVRPQRAGGDPLTSAKGGEAGQDLVRLGVS